MNNPQNPTIHPEIVSNHSAGQIDGNRTPSSGSIPFQHPAPPLINNPAAVIEAGNKALPLEQTRLNAAIAIGEIK